MRHVFRLIAILLGLLCLRMLFLPGVFGRGEDAFIQVAWMAIIVMAAQVAAMVDAGLQLIRNRSSAANIAVLVLEIALACSVGGFVAYRAFLRW